MLSNGICSGRTRFLNRTVSGSSPAAARDRVEHQLQCEADARPGDAAIGQDRAFVGRDRPGPAAIGRKIVRAGQDARHLRGFQASGERIGRIGAGIDDRLAVDAAQPPVALGIDGDLVMVLAAVGVGGQVLAAVLDPANRDGRGAARASRGRLPRRAECPCSRSRRRRRARRCGRGLLPGRGIRRGRCARYAAFGSRCGERAGRRGGPSTATAAAPLDRRHALARRARSSRVTLIGASKAARDADVDRPSRERRCRPNARERSAEPGWRAASMSWTAGSSSRSRVTLAAMSSASARGRRNAHGDQLADMPRLAVASGGCSETLKPGNPDTARIGLDAVQVGRRENPVPTGFGEYRCRECGRARAGCGQKPRPACRAGEYRRHIAPSPASGARPPCAAAARRRPGAFRVRVRRSIRDVLDQALRRADKLAARAAEGRQGLTGGRPPGKEAGRSRDLATDDQRRTLTKADIRPVPRRRSSAEGSRLCRFRRRIGSSRTQFVAPRHKKAFGFALISLSGSSLFKGLRGPLGREFSLAASLVNEGSMRPVTRGWHVLSIPENSAIFGFREENVDHKF